MSSFFKYKRKVGTTRPQSSLFMGQRSSFSSGILISTCICWISALHLACDFLLSKFVSLHPPPKRNLLFAEHLVPSTSNFTQIGSRGRSRMTYTCTWARTSETTLLSWVTWNAVFNNALRNVSGNFLKWNINNNAASQNRPQNLNYRLM